MDALLTSSAALANQPDLASTLSAVCTAAAALTCADAATVLLLDRQVLTTAATTELSVAAVGLARTETGEGPCLDTVRTRRTIVVDDLGQDQRWPAWADRMQRLRWSSVLNVRLMTSDRCSLGLLSLLGRRIGQFDDHAVGISEGFAVLASLHIVSAQTEQQLQLAMVARHRVGMAQGILMGRLGLTYEEAFDALRRYSQHYNVKLARVAAHVIEFKTMPEPHRFPPATARAADANASTT